VLAGSVYLGAPGRRLAATLLPVWRYAALTEPVGERLAEMVAFAGSVTDTDGIDHFRVVGGDRLLWASPETTWQGEPRRFARSIQRRIATVFPALGPVAIARSWSGVVGQTVHGMPQIGQLQPGVWVLGGFGRQGLNTTAIGGELVARGLMTGDDRWRLFAPFELVWAGGSAGRIAGQAAALWSRGRATAAGALSRYRERARVREQGRERARQARMAAMQARAAASAMPRDDRDGA
jgi:glycine/D-amino acid oxidase-like deaminating enzyme